MTRQVCLALLLATLVTAWLVPHPAAASPLAIERRIALGAVAGRIDHLAYDPGRRRLLVAELGNDSLAIVDLAAGRVVRRIAGLSAPQGVGYVAADDTIYVANGGDGTLRLFRGADGVARGRIALGSDADDVRIDAAAGRIYVGYGAGGIAVIDAARHALLARIALPVHPEGFAFDPAAGRLFVNLPDARAIAVLNPAAATVAAMWHQSLTANFPLALAGGGRLAILFRRPPALLLLRASDGAAADRLAACGDADDVFLDAGRHRLYVSCGAGSVDVITTGSSAPARLARIATAPGARTSLFVPALDRLFLAVPAAPGQPAAIWVLRPGD